MINWGACENLIINTFQDKINLIITQKKAPKNNILFLKNLSPPSLKIENFANHANRSDFQKSTTNPNLN